MRLVWIRRVSGNTTRYWRRTKSRLPLSKPGLAREPFWTRKPRNYDDCVKRVHRAATTEMDTELSDCDAANRLRMWEAAGPYPVRA